MSLVLGIPVVVDYFETRLVLRLPTAVLAGLLAICAIIGLSRARPTLPSVPAC